MPDQAAAVVANTDARWLDHFRAAHVRVTVDEVNFWRPASQRRFRALPLGGPVFFRLKHPVNAIGGFGFFAADAHMSASLAWEIFGEKNGDSTIEQFLERISGLRAYLADRANPIPPEDRPLGCLVLREAVFLPEREWLPWGADEGWSPRIVDYKVYDLATTTGGRLSGLLRSLHPETVPDLTENFVLAGRDTRRVAESLRAEREGQGAFRVRILGAYNRRCALTGERAVPTLEAAHIQPYRGPSSNHVQNGLLLRADVHHLFDGGYVTVTPELRVRVSDRLRSEFDNGAAYYALNGERVAIPSEPALQPSRDALEWHATHIFR